MLMERVNKNLVGAIAVIFGLLAIAGALAADITVSANVQKYISVTFNYTVVNFGDVMPPVSNKSAEGAFKATIDTNYYYNVYAYGTNFTDGAGTLHFSISNLLFNVRSEPTVPLENAVSLSETSQFINSFDWTVTENYHGYWLNVPSGTPAGHYTSTVSIIYANQ